MADLEIFMIIDGSGSMSGVKNDVVQGINDFIDEQKDDAKATGDEIRFTLTTFDDQVKEVYDSEDIAFVNHVKVGDTFLGGSTALYDAIGRTLAKVDDTGSSKKIVAIYTDGGENASREFKREDIKKLLEEKQATGLWQVIYMSAEFGDFNQATGIGIAAGNILTGTTRGTTNAHFARMSSGTTTYKNTMSNATQDFYADTEIAAAAAGVATASLGGQVAADVLNTDPNSDPGDESDAS